MKDNFVLGAVLGAIGALAIVHYEEIKDFTEARIKEYNESKDKFSTPPGTKPGGNSEELLDEE